MVDEANGVPHEPKRVLRRGNCASASQFTHVTGYHPQMVVGRQRAVRWHLGSRKVSVCVHGARSCAHGAYGLEHLDGTFDTYTF